MGPTAYYNEFDPKAAAWLRELIKRGLIADGEVDERDLWDVAATDLVGFTQVHLCAGIGVWSYALRSAGWPDDRPVWTASFPCQPFSAAGKGKGFADERHLWPAGHYLIEQCRPAVVFGEQVASKDGLAWFDLVQADLEGTGYACGAVDSCAAGFGAPHIRQRLYWVADAERIGRERWRAGETGRRDALEPVAGPCDAGGMAHANSERRRLRQSGREDANDAASASEAGGLALSDNTERRPDLPGGHDGHRQDAGRPEGASDIGTGGATGGLVDTNGSRRQPGQRDDQAAGHWAPSAAAGGHDAGPAGPVNGLWSDADWLFCRDGKWRPVEPGTFPLAHGAPARVGRLRGYGNGLVAPAAQAFVEAYLETGVAA